MHAHRDLAKVFVRLRVRNHFFTVVKQIQFLSRDIAEERIGLNSRLLDHMVFQHTMGNDHIRAK